MADITKYDKGWRNTMLALPDYIVLDFLGWISQNYPRNIILLDSLLNDKELAISYAEKYLYEEHRDCKVYEYKHCKRHLIRYINQVILSIAWPKTMPLLGAAE